MNYVQFGNTGMKVSPLCLGTMSYGGPTQQFPWALTDEQSRPFIKKALELGINFFDTANVYNEGGSEETVGKALREFASREDYVLATKVFNQVHSTDIIPWSPLAAGLLARNDAKDKNETKRAKTDNYSGDYYNSPSDFDVIKRVQQVAQTKDVSAAQLSLAWLINKPEITAPIVGATKLSHIQEAVAALSIKLTEQEIKLIEEPYQYHRVVGFDE